MDIDTIIIISCIIPGIIICIRSLFSFRKLKKDIVNTKKAASSDIEQIVKFYIKILQANNVKPAKHNFVDVKCHGNKYIALEHASYMCAEVLEMLNDFDTNEFKIMMSLGFIQGILWSHGLFSL